MSLRPVLLLLSLTVTQCSSSSNRTYPIGDPRGCQVDENSGQLMFEVLPGLGWDNLVNENRGQVVNFNYSKCKTTEDRRYLIPDVVITVPIKTSSMNVFSELYDHWSNYKTDTSFSINTGGSASIKGIGISGSFSTEYEHVKSRQIEDKTVTTKAQARYVRYTAKVLPDAQLNPSFRSRVLKIASHIQHNRKLSASYDSELLVRDFGTHVLTSVDAGASIVKVDQVKSSLLQDQTMNKFQVTQSASVSFLGLASIKESSKFSITTTQLQKYMNSITNSDIRSYGGPALDPVNFTLHQWTSEIGNDLVAVDKNGFPLDYVLTKEALPELSESLVQELGKNVRTAIETYFKHNTYPGCTNDADPNFSHIANTDDGSCHAPYTNSSFGGVYQTCEFSGRLINNENLCDQLSTENPQSQGYSCPEGYEAVILHSGETSKNQHQHECHSCWLFFHCCHDQSYHGSARYTSYWCRANGQAQDDSGYLFGGLYSDQTLNFVTQSKTCPQYYNAYKITANINVCLSDDYDLGAKYALPFAGFYSCKHGNPLTKTNSKACPSGFSNHLATIDNHCEISYCVRTGALSELKFPMVNLPPFISVPAESLQDDASYIISNNGEEWVQLLDPSSKREEPEEGKWTTLGSAATEMKTLMKNFNKNKVVYSDDETGLSKGAVAGLSVGLTTLACIIVAVVVMVMRSRQQYREYRQLE